MENNKKNVKKGIVRTCIACALALTMAVGGSLLYLTDKDEVDNIFTVGNVSIQLEEPGWVSSSAEKMVPNQEVAKDPQIRNDGDNDAIVFLKLSVPVADVTSVADDGTMDAREPQELIWFKAEADSIATHANNFAADWINLPALEEGTDHSKDYRTYVFGYNKALTSGATTAPLFEKIQLKNIIENEVPTAAAQNIKVGAFAIQATDIISDGADITGTLNAANLQTIFEIYMNQQFTRPAPGVEG